MNLLTFVVSSVRSLSLPQVPLSSKMRETAILSCVAFRDYGNLFNLSGLRWLISNGFHFERGQSHW